jgi:hypothetical protein
LGLGSDCIAWIAVEEDFRMSPEGVRQAIREDSRKLTPGVEKRFAHDGSSPEDYSLICRIRNSPTGMLLIVSAGIKHFGTEAGGRILADPAALGTILNKLPCGWEDKDLQILLHMKVIGNTPAEPEVVASHVW